MHFVNKVTILLLLVLLSACEKSQTVSPNTDEISLDEVNYHYDSNGVNELKAEIIIPEKDTYVVVGLEYYPFAHGLLPYFYLNLEELTYESYKITFEIMPLNSEFCDFSIKIEFFDSQKRIVFEQKKSRKLFCNNTIIKNKSACKLLGDNVNKYYVANIHATEIDQGYNLVAISAENSDRLKKKVEITSAIPLWQWEEQLIVPESNLITSENK